MKLAFFIGVLALPLGTAAPNSFVGAKVCASCHSVEYASQSASAHAGTLSRVADRASFLPGRLSRDPHYRYDVLRDDNSLRVHISDGSDLMDLPLEWAFGAGRQAFTFVTRVNRECYVEHFATWYAATNAYGPTPGQGKLQPKSLQEAAGLLYKVADPQVGIQGCFECHSTGPVSFDREGNAAINEAGVRCEACHGPGSAHVASAGHTRMTSPATLSAAGLNNFCGRCHRQPHRPAATDWNYAWNVRHQPVYLSQSQCFLKSAGRLSCLTCHDPHEPSGKIPAASFNAKCGQCHAGCVVKERVNCVDCHMPLVSPQPPLRFTNHWIGIYREGAKLKPVR
jgi:hypothetical protein